MHTHFTTQTVLDFNSRLKTYLFSQTLLVDSRLETRFFQCSLSYMPVFFLSVIVMLPYVDLLESWSALFQNVHPFKPVYDKSIPYNPFLSLLSCVPVFLILNTLLQLWLISPLYSTCLIHPDNLHYPYSVFAQNNLCTSLTPPLVNNLTLKLQI